MKSLFDKLNLRPQERRWVVIVALILFVLLNMWFVWPYFGDWGKVQADLQKSRYTLERYQREIARRGEYERRARELETTGSEMLTNETQFQSIISAQALGAGVSISSMIPGRGGGTHTNQFFQEGSISVQFTCGGSNLVDFLVAIAAQNSMIRVGSLSVRPDQNQTRLTGNIMFVGNYQRAVTNAPATVPARGTIAPASSRKGAREKPKTKAGAKSKNAIPPPRRKNT